MRFKWQAGKHNLIADTLSRFLISPEEPMDSAEMEEDRAFVRCTITSNDSGLEWLCDTADEDPTFKEIVKAKCNGSSVNHLPNDHPARAFRNVWEFISVEEGFGSPLLIYDGTRIIVSYLPQHAPASSTSSSSLTPARSRQRKPPSNCTTGWG